MRATIPRSRRPPARASACRCGKGEAGPSRKSPGSRVSSRVRLFAPSAAPAVAPNPGWSEMLSSRFKPWHVPLFLAKYAWLKARRMPVLVHFEVTQRCNARCGFCDYWKTDASEKDRELKSFAEAARFFDPMLVTWTGGEPLLRRDLEALVSAVNGAIRLKYVTLITHGGMLSPERAQSLWD